MPTTSLYRRITIDDDNAYASPTPNANNIRVPATWRYPRLRPGYRIGNTTNFENNIVATSMYVDGRNLRGRTYPRKIKLSVNASRPIKETTFSTGRLNSDLERNPARLSDFFKPRRHYIVFKISSVVFRLRDVSSYRRSDLDTRLLPVLWRV